MNISLSQTIFIRYYYMKKIVIILMLCLGLNAYAYNWSKVIYAIATVESNHNPSAINGCYVGYLQIGPIIVKDCNRILQKRKSNKRFILKDRYDKNKSIEMFLIIQSYYNPKNSIEKAIRMWNGGPNYSIRSTQGYYNKVRKHLK